MVKFVPLDNGKLVNVDYIGAFTPIKNNAGKPCWTVVSKNGTLLGVTEAYFDPELSLTQSLLPAHGVECVMLSIQDDGLPMVEHSQVAAWKVTPVGDDASSVDFIPVSEGHLKFLKLPDGRYTDVTSQTFASLNELVEAHTMPDGKNARRWHKDRTERHSTSHQLPASMLTKADENS